MTTSGKIMQDALDAIRDAFYAEWPDTPQNQRVREIASAMAKSEYVEDPEQMVMGLPGHDPGRSLARCGNGTVAIHFPIQPAWSTYANRAIEALDLIEPNWRENV